MLFLHVSYRVRPWKSASQPHFHIFISAESRAAPAAKCFLPDCVLRHLVKMVADILENISRLLEKANGTRGVAGVVEGHLPAVVTCGVQFKSVMLDQVGGKFRDVYHPG